MYDFCINIRFHSSIALIKYLNVLTVLVVGDTRKEYCIYIVQVNVLFLMIIGMTSAEMVPIQANVSGMIEYIPAPLFLQ